MKVIPCKTFLVGEYAVLIGGEAIGLATGPGFTESSTEFNYHPESAAALYLGSTVFSKIDSLAPGGFGKSTAEFIFAYLSKNKTSDLKSVLNSYLDLFNKTPAQKPSGADLVIQCLGQVTNIKSDKLSSTAGEWPFKNLGFAIIPTGLKIATHEHLQNLNREVIRDLPARSKQVVAAFLKADSDLFFAQLNAWKKALEAKGLTHPDVVILMSKLNAEIAKNLRSDFIIKQCGAFGADVIILIFEKNQKEAIKKIVINFGLSIIATEVDLMDGVLKL